MMRSYSFMMMLQFTVFPVKNVEKNYPLSTVKNPHNR